MRGYVTLSKRESGAAVFLWFSEIFLLHNTNEWLLQTFVDEHDENNENNEDNESVVVDKWQITMWEKIMCCYAQ